MDVVIFCINVYEDIAYLSVPNDQTKMYSSGGCERAVLNMLGKERLCWCRDKCLRNFLDRFFHKVYCFRPANYHL